MTFDGRFVYRVGDFRDPLALGDLNADGAPDLAVADEGSSAGSADV